MVKTKLNQVCLITEKTEVKNATGGDAPEFAKQDELGSL